MTIFNLTAEEKTFLFELFYEKTQLGFQEKKFPLEKLIDASGAKKKLLEGSEVDEGKTTFVAGEISVTVGEATILKELVTAVTEATPSQFEVITQLKETLK